MPNRQPISIPLRRDTPRQMTVFPGGGSSALSLGAGIENPRRVSKFPAQCYLRYCVLNPRPRYSGRDHERKERLTKEAWSIWVRIRKRRVAGATAAINPKTPIRRTLSGFSDRMSCTSPTPRQIVNQNSMSLCNGKPVVKLVEGPAKLGAS
jgi:hypothetical protein